MSQTVLDNRYYYTYKGVHFGIQFPIECAVNNIPNTGPESVLTAICILR